MAASVVVSQAGTILALDALLAGLNAGSGDPSGDFLLQTAGGGADIATMPFSTTAFAGAADVAGTVKAAANSITSSGNPGGAATIGQGKFRNKANVALFTFNMGTASTAMNVTSVSVPADATSISCSGLEVSLAFVAA